MIGWLASAGAGALAVATGAVIAAPCAMNVEVPGDLGFEAMLGSAVAIDGSLMAVGAPLETGLAWATGAVYVYRLHDGAWVHEARLIAEDAGWGDMLGVDVDIQDGVIVAGAWFNDAFGRNSGAGYVFTRDAVGDWSAPQKLLPPDPGVEDAFGRTVAFGDGFCAVGAPLDDDQGASSGSIHVFDRDADGNWTHAAKIVQPSLAEGHQLGLGLAADGNRILAGAPWAHEGRGEIVLWSCVGSIWSQEWFMSMETTGSPEDYFGFAVSVNGDRMAAGCYRDDTSEVDAGSVWILDRVFDGWVGARLDPPEPQSDAQFGVSVSLSGDFLVVGSRYAQVEGVNGGRIDVMKHVGGDVEWKPIATMSQPVPAAESEFGWAVDVQGDIVVTGALYQPDSGAVYAWSGLLDPCGCQGDLDGDGDVGVNDLLAVLEGWSGGGSQGDVDGDGQTGVDDLLLLISVWGPCGS